jgi:hypothetical protein
VLLGSILEKAYDLVAVYPIGLGEATPAPGTSNDVKVDPCFKPCLPKGAVS